MRTLTILLGILAAIALVLHIAPQMMDTCSTLIADMGAYLEWIIESRSMGSDLTMLADGPVNQ